MLTIVITALLGTMAAQVAPGPNLIAVAGVALSQGRRAALCVVAGVATGILVWAAAFAAGLSALFVAFPNAAVGLQLVGGSYFLFIAVKALRSACVAAPSLIQAAGRRLTLAAAYRRGLFVVLTNPKAAMLWAAVSAFLLASGLPSVAVLLFAPLGSLTALLIYGSYGLLFSTAPAQRIYAKTASLCEAAFGALFGAIGGKLLVEGVRELRA
ncbi:MAG: LysE family transporter [Desulfosarcinaceae bacterium]|nr:LysE family transporter [Desulfosarcinaceae bacterium]